MKEEFKPNVQVLVRLAEVFYQNNLNKKTHLHSASRTDWNSFGRYICWMKNKNYVECKIDGKEQKYQLTSMGQEMFDTILKLNEHVKTAKL